MRSDRSFRSLAEVAHLLAHGRYEIAVYTAHGSHRPFCFVSTPQAKFEAAFHIRLEVRHYFDDLEHVCLFMSMRNRPGKCIGYEQRTAPLTARSSPRLIVVPTAMKFLCPDSVLTVSRGKHASELMNSFCANSYL